MKNCIYIITVIAATLVFSLMTARAQGEQDVEVDGHIAAIPCERNPAAICPDILIFPRAYIEVYRFGGEKVVSIDISEESAKEAKSDFSIRLAPDNYIFYIENKLNKQEALFGPVEISSGIKKMQANFTLYSSYPNAKTEPREREVCFQKKVVEFTDSSVGPAFDFSPEMECVTMTHERYRSLTDHPIIKLPAQ